MQKHREDLLDSLEIILPLRNPTAVLDQTAKSIAAQTDRRFSVLISDNHSTKGTEFIDAAAGQLDRRGHLGKARAPAL